MVECAILEMLGSISVCHQKDDNSSNGGDVFGASVPLLLDDFIH